MKPHSAQAGFTLVEMLVALSIFAILGAAGVGLLRSSVDTQAAVGDRLSSLAGTGRIHALLESDVGQMRTGAGPDQSFTGDPDGFRMIRGGGRTLSAESRSVLQAVTWSGDGQAIVRTGSALPASDKQKSTIALGDGIARVSFRYRSIDGAWTERFSATPQQPLPAAIEITLGISGAPVTMVVATPPQGRPA